MAAVADPVPCAAALSDDDVATAVLAHPALQGVVGGVLVSASLPSVVFHVCSPPVSLLHRKHPTSHHRLTQSARHGAPAADARPAAEPPLARTVQVTTVTRTFQNAAQAAAAIRLARAAAGPAGVEPASRKVVVVINPHSGAHRALHKFRKRVEPLLRAAGIARHVCVTAHAGHARELGASYFAEHADAEGVVFVSGDGTVHEFMDGVLRSLLAQAHNDAACSELPRPALSGAGAVSSNSSSSAAAMSSVEGASMAASPVAEASLAARIAERLARLRICSISCGTQNALSVGLGMKQAEYATLCVIRGATRPLDAIELGNAAGARAYALCGIGWGLPGAIASDSEGWRWLGRARYAALKVKHGAAAGLGMVEFNATVSYSVQLPAAAARAGAAEEPSRCSPRASLDASTDDDAARHTGARVTPGSESASPHELHAARSSAARSVTPAAVSTHAAPSTPPLVACKPNCGICAITAVNAPAARLQSVQYLLHARPPCPAPAAPSSDSGTAASASTGGEVAASASALQPAITSSATSVPTLAAGSPPDATASDAATATATATAASSAACTISVLQPAPGGGTPPVGAQAEHVGAPQSAAGRACTASGGLVTERGAYMAVGAVNTSPDARFCHASDGKLDLILARKGGAADTTGLLARYVGRMIGVADELSSPLYGYVHAQYVLLQPDADNADVCCNVDGEVFPGPGPFTMRALPGLFTAYGRV